MKKKVALVTGGFGFIGSHTVDELLSRDYEVRVVDNLTGGHFKNLESHKNNKNLNFEKIDIRNIKFDNKIFNEVDYVFHFAGIGDIVPSIEKPTDYIDVNVNGTLNVVEASKYSKVQKVVYAASSSCYGLAETPTDEKHVISPEYPYALSKYMGEQILLHWCKVYKLPAISIRIFNAYGDRVKTTGAYGAVFGVFFKQKLDNKPFTVVGDGNQKRDFIYVTDVAKAFIKAADSSKNNEIYNLGTGKPKSINELINLIGGPVINIPKRPGEPDCTWANINKITRHLDWVPEISFKKGVEEMIKNINNWEKAPLWTPDKIKDATKLWFKHMSNHNGI